MYICKEISYQENILLLRFDINNQRITSLSYFVKHYVYAVCAEKKNGGGAGKPTGCIQFLLKTAKKSILKTLTQRDNLHF